SNEVRQPVVFSTLIIMLVFLPLFFLGGVEGRLLQPLGIAYLVAIAASLLVALTLTPALSHLLLSGSRAVGDAREALPVRFLRAAYRPLLARTLAYAPWVVGMSLLLVVVALVSAAQFGRSFLPEFNEGSLTIEMVAPPGTALSE